MATSSRKNESFYSKHATFFSHSFTSLATLVFVLVFGLLGVHLLQNSQAATGTPEIKSGVSGSWCMNDANDSFKAENHVDTYKCNGSPGESWTFTSNTIKFTGNHCIEPLDGATADHSPVVVDTCNGHAAQTWVKYQGGFENKNASKGSAALCLAVPGGDTGAQLRLETCNSNADQNWALDTYIPPVSGADLCTPSGSTEGDKVASVAKCELVLWKGGKVDGRTATHTQLLSAFNAYSSGDPEPWCADFVSYVYKQAGYRFTGGTDGWDVKGAFDLENVKGFTYPSSHPKVGDIAIFAGADDNGHAEIVVSTKGPTFVYGDSGSGNMAEDQYTGGLYGYVAPK